MQLTTTWTLISTENGILQNLDTEGGLVEVINSINPPDITAEGFILEQYGSIKFNNSTGKSLYARGIEEICKINYLLD